jgi:hypothetical protein
MVMTDFQEQSKKMLNQIKIIPRLVPQTVDFSKFQKKLREVG